MGGADEQFDAIVENYKQLLTKVDVDYNGMSQDLLEYKKKMQTEWDIEEKKCLEHIETASKSKNVEDAIKDINDSYEKFKTNIQAILLKYWDMVYWYCLDSNILIAKSQK